MIAEKILRIEVPANCWWEEAQHLDNVPKQYVLSAMQSYADFYYWLGKEGWVRDGDHWYYLDKICTEDYLYETYLTNSKPKE